jgi:hypothetical protein
MKKGNLKLTLHRETLHPLARREMTAVPGAANVKGTASFSSPSYCVICKSLGCF